jgi:serine phosphatase RsbU (regulator of sigma subunit)
MNIETVFPITLAEIDSSLLYAQTIQNGLLPKKRHFEKIAKDYFIFYQPQQTIGGDFYWMSQKNDTIYFALADCTGHGISGAMLSVLGISLLNYVIQKNHFLVGEFLSELDKKWIETFNHDVLEQSFNNDWLEITLISFDTQTRQLQYASASGEFLLFQNNSYQLLKGNHYPVGGWQLEKKREFDTGTILLESNAKLFFYSDGIKHQFNSINTKKFGRTKLINFLHNYSNLSMNKIRTQFEHDFNSWKQTTHQTDDVSLIGIEL